ncbi:MAG TPA: phosphatidylglycerol lysyltransferase domain-containing protein [Deltaproteobacteria bacterium]|nr:phosphatidylglycerol lysyltransferase domain-containing protein [Deltaproteobacteria bacterium]HPR55382.1 phosphatidylglycerol lysyltransferase domain-containing protein [Deltaproteobacteria bacterium]
MPDFEPISLSRQDEYRRLLSSSDITASDYSFINLWAWADEHGLSWSFDSGLVWVRQDLPEPCLWAPVGPHDGIEWADLFARADLGALPFTRIPEELLTRWMSALPGRVQAEEAREHWDYLYSVTELVELAGNRFHKKKNLLNQFLKRYAYDYRPIDPSLTAEVLATQGDWCAWRDCEAVETLAAENLAIRKVMDGWSRLAAIMGGAILVEGRIVAFTVGEAFRDDTLLIHFEKGLGEYPGIYQAINRMFLQEHREFSIVNREQDLGNEGLRQAKLSYNPTGHVRKYRVRIS